MEYYSVIKVAGLWNLSPRTVRDYCAKGLIDGAFLTGKTWNIPKDAVKPNGKSELTKGNNLLRVLKEEKDMNLSGGIYHKTQIALTYNSNHIEGSTLTEQQTRLIFETNTIGVDQKGIRVDDIIETGNHFRAFDFIIDNATSLLTVSFIKKLHFILKSGTQDSRKAWFNVGEYKSRPNEVGGKETCPPNQVHDKMVKLLSAYNAKKDKTLEDVISFHKEFESIHPFQDGNGRVGRLIMFKECLANNIVPFIIEDEIKYFYYRGLSEWDNERGYLMDTCLSAQDKYKKWLEYFEI